MTRRRLLLWAIMALLLVWILYLAQPDPETLIKPGMTMEQVESLFGRKGTCVGDRGSDSPDAVLFYTWRSGVRRVTVAFELLPINKDKPGRTTGEVKVNYPASFTDAFYRWFGW